MTLNFVQIETLTGIKEFELYQGDITNLPFQTDLLCISTFKDDYTPTTSSIVGQFLGNGISIEELSANPSLNFTDSLGIWVSPEIAGKNFKKILCLEIQGSASSFEESLRNLFSAISVVEMKQDGLSTLALPLLGAGDQEIDTNIVISKLINSSLHFLQYSKSINKIYFIVKSNSKSQLFNIEMNKFLGRKKVISPKGALTEILKNDISSLINKLKSENKLFYDFSRVINSEFRSFEFGAIARKVTDFVISELNPNSKNIFDLRKKIDMLNDVHTAPWIQHYMHIIRHFGNEAVHNNEDKHKIPDQVESKDLEVGMICMIRIIEFYLAQKAQLMEKRPKS